MLLASSKVEVHVPLKHDVLPVCPLLTSPAHRACMMTLKVRPSLIPTLTLLTRHPVWPEPVRLVGVGVDPLEGVGDHEDDGAVLPGGLPLGVAVHDVTDQSVSSHTRG